MRKICLKVALSINTVLKSVRSFSCAIYQKYLEKDILEIIHNKHKGNN